MILTINDIAKMLDLSCVRMFNTKEDNIKLINAAKEYHCGQISLLQCFLDLAKSYISRKDNIKIVGNVSFPSGSDTTELKVIQAKQIVDKCDEIDLTMNVGMLKSGMYEEVEKDILEVKQAIAKKTLKIIIEANLLNRIEIEKACEICIKTGASFVKTSTGWSGSTNIEQIKLIKSIVGNRILIKASGGIRSIDILLDMYKNGATRFGVNLKSGLYILEECMTRGGTIEF